MDGVFGVLEGKGDGEWERWAIERFWGFGAGRDEGGRRESKCEVVD